MTNKKLKANRFKLKELMRLKGKLKHASLEYK